MFLAHASSKRPIAMTTLIICLMLFGILAYRNVGVDLLPRVDVPFVSITVVYPGASPGEIETTVAKQVEDAVVQVDGIKHLTTTCLNNFCQVLIEFELGRDVDVAATDVREKVGLIKEHLPDEAEEPQILKYDINATPVVTVALKGSLPVDELYDFADETLADRFSTLSGVAKVELIGGQVREVIVEVDRRLLAARGLALGQIVAAMSRENLKVPVGQIDDGQREISLMFDAEASEIVDLGNIEIGVVRGERVYLRDVARFTFGTARMTSRASYDGQPCIVLKVTKKGEANAAAVVSRVRTVFDQVRKSLPGGMELVWFRDDGDFVNATVKDGLTSLRDGVILTGLVLLLFLADIRTAFIAFVSIPVTMIIALMTFTWFNYTMNVITMSAFGISVGILVANSIVVLENITFAFEARKGTVFDVKSVVENATSQVGLAVAASALTNIVVFLPIASMKTITGQFLAPFAVTVTAATFASLLISFTLTPILAIQTFSYGGRINRFLGWMLAPWNRLYKGIERGYVGSLRWLLKAPLLLVVVTVLICAWAFTFYVPRVQMDFVSQTDMGDLTVRLEFPADNNIERTSVRTTGLAERIRKDPAVRHVTVTCGKVQGIIGQVSEGAYLAEIQLRLSSKLDRTGDNIKTVMERIRRELVKEPDCIWSVMVPSVAGGGASQDIVVMVSGPDLDELNRIGVAASALIRDDPASSDVTHSVRPGRPEIRILPNRAVLHDMGVSSSDLGLTLRADIAGIKTSTYKKGDRSYDIRVRYEQETGREQIDRLNLPGASGRPILLGAVAALHETLQPTQITRFDKSRSVSLYANAAKGYGMGTAMVNQTGIFSKLLPAGYAIQFSGMAEKMQEAFAEFKLVTIVAILLTYLLLAAMMESWSQPVIILLTVPFSYLGLYMAIYHSGSTLSIFGLLAGIMLVGVVVNAAILIIDEVNTLRRDQGYPKREALALAAERKFRPILMSCVAALFGMLPMATGTGLGSELRSGIGIGSVGGILVSSLLSLYFIPAVYLVIGQSDKSQNRKIKSDLAKIPDLAVPSELEF